MKNFNDEIREDYAHRRRRGRLLDKTKRVVWKTKSRFIA